MQKYFLTDEQRGHWSKPRENHDVRGPFSSRTNNQSREGEEVGFDDRRS